LDPATSRCSFTGDASRARSQQRRRQRVVVGGLLGLLERVAAIVAGTVAQPESSTRGNRL